MRLSLLWKLTLAFMVIAITTAALMALAIRLTSADRLARLIMDQQRSSLAAALVEYYSENGSWNGIESNWQQLRQRSVPTPAFVPTQNAANNDPGTFLPPVNRDRRRFFGLADAQGRVLIAVDQQTPVGSAAPQDQLLTGQPVIVNGKKVGTILNAPITPRFNPEETLFLQRVNDSLLLAVVGAVFVALALGLALARTLIRPVQALTQAAQNIAAGQLVQEVKVNSHDEIGQLADSFNQMSREVARVNQMRKQMTADIAHDLRTPLTVIAGYVESMRDGVLQPTEERLSLIYTEIERLQNLVGDLKMLSQADAGELPLHPLPIEPRSLLEHAAAPFQHRAEQQGVNLSIDAEDGLPEVRVDEARMMQVFGNLVSNALRYTPEGGTITLQARRENGGVELAVRDNGEGISQEDLPFIFDRFRRADPSRHADSGESGLGLAIVKALVEAHHGSVQAESSLGKGTTIRIDLPGSQGGFW
jgi:two-component system, OmpR family, sensor histidine kinase BaeS